MSITKLFTLKVTVIFSVILWSLFFISFVAGATTLEAPSTISLKNVFTVKISADTVEKHDVKIYIRNDSDAILSEIQDGNWKNGRYYVNDAYPEKKEYILRAISFATPVHLCVKLRLSEKRKTKPPTPEFCIAIILKNQEDPLPKNTSKETSSNENDPEEKVKSTQLKNNSRQKNALPSPSITLSLENTSSQVESQEEKIALYQPKSTGRVIINSQEKVHFGMMATFFVFAISILIWIVRKDRIRREQENI
ncbi:MAG: hypothetical protein AABY00_00155 [Nanoarchaeota archaeon]